MKRLLLAIKGVVLAAALILAVGLGLRAAVDVVSHPLTGNEGPPVARLPALEREIAAPAAGQTVRLEFPVSNDGERRLVVRSLRRACCDGPAPPPTVVLPGKSGTLVVEADAEALRKRGEHLEGFGTNDPRLPEFWLKVRVAGAAAHATAESDNSHSILVDGPR
jgi:hypothetical protein